MPALYVGTCGWSYADWKGPFYPARIAQPAMLPYYARRFAAVEVDATYYRLLPVKTFATMVERTPPEFRFTVKLPGSVTHLPADAAPDVPDDAHAWRESVEPLIAGGRFACGLVQFPNAFRPGPRANAYLSALRDALDDVPLVAEFRHAEWQTGETLQALADLGIGWTNVDEPRFEGLMRASSDATSPVAYVRFHGRNAKTWWRGDATTRYDYLYTEEELAPWVDRIGDLFADPHVREVYAMFNNHRGGQAPRNAEMFMHMLDAAGIDYVEPPSPPEPEPESPTLPGL